MKLPSVVPCVLLIMLAVLATSSFGQEPAAVGLWKFEGNLADASGRGNEAFVAEARFSPAQGSQGLVCNKKGAVVPGSPELRLAPGLRIECWARIDALGTSWQPLLIKDGAYQLRLDPPDEDGAFSFFVNLGGWEPRVRSKATAKVGTWYHLAAGWDGNEIWLEVNGDRTSMRRTGTPSPSVEPLELGLFDGVLDDVRIENPSAPTSGVAQWMFEGDLRDSSQRGYTLSADGAQFAPVEGGQALKLTSGAARVASTPELQLAPGLRLDCSVCFEKLPAAGCQIAMKDGEYQLRINPAQEGSRFAFFVHLDGWEPRVTSEEPVVAGKWYRLRAGWDGFALTLDVNGRRSRITRSGLPQATENPLAIGGTGLLVDNLKIENPRLPVFEVRDARQEHAILVAGRPEKFTTTIRNLGRSAERVAVRFELPEGTRLLDQADYELGAMPTGAEKTIVWSVQADTAALGSAEIQVTAAGMPAVTAQHPLVFFASEEAMPQSASAKLPASTRLPADGAPRASGVTWYVDGLAGDNGRPGTSPETAWRNFTPISGRTLQPGERLLLRRGSVFNQELKVSARGTEQDWAEIGAYGSGPRPTIRRNWDIDDRCALVQNPDYLRIRGLVFCYAGKGLIVSYTQSGHRGLVIEDCIAHHIEGLYRPNSHGIPEWLDRTGAPGDGLNHSSGIAICGASARELTLRDCEMFQCSSGWFVQGTDALVDRVFCHDNIVHNTSPHPFLVSVRRAVLSSSIFDASGWHASAGTMGIMLGGTHGLVIRNCHFRNQPDSGSHDEGGIDFEAGGNGCLIDGCTFENNAGAAIEVLGLKSPQTTNIEIRRSRFIQNNTAKKLGPSEIFIWGGVRDPSVCRSTGLVEGNGYVLLPGIEFFVNQAPQLTSWTLRGNTPYKSAAEIDRAMPLNRPPVVSAGADIRTDRLQVALAGSVKDDGKPSGGPPSIAWEVLEGPGPVTLDDARAATTSARFEQPGDYLLRLKADDGQLWLSDTVAVHILPAGTSVAAAWEFNTNLDKEGWTEVNPGTQVRQWQNQDWPTTSHPVKHVAGGHYVLAIDKSPDA
ncbi:MAG: LamG-like jellyroll fold domain-containing protein, partial [Thermoguttaceae bacterium]